MSGGLGCLYGVDCRSNEDCGPHAYCSGGHCVKIRGSVQLFASFRHKKVIERVEVTVHSTTHQETVVASLKQEAGNWRGEILDMPAGGKQSFRLKAFEEDNKLIAEQEVKDILVRPGPPGFVGFVVHTDVGLPESTWNSPDIVGLWASSLQVVQGRHTQWKIFPKPGQKDMKVMWKATQGTFAPANRQATTWFAPNKPGLHYLHLTLYNKDSQSTFSFPTEVGSEGSSSLPLHLNVWPTIVSFKASTQEARPAQSLLLYVLAVDREGHSLQYDWRDEDCGGVFKPLNVSETRWTAPQKPPASGTCRLSIVVFDGQGGLIHKQLRIAVYE